jgi:hypothetical protein
VERQAKRKYNGRHCKPFRHEIPIHKHQNPNKFQEPNVEMMKTDRVRRLLI